MEFRICKTSSAHKKNVICNTVSMKDIAELGPSSPGLSEFYHGSLRTGLVMPSTAMQDGG